MIYDSIPWKESLLRIANDIDRRSHQKRWTDRSGYLMERDVMIASFAMRKLLDTPAKISDESRAEPVDVLSHPLVGAPPDFWNRHEFWELSDLEDGKREQISVRELCNRVIHSVVFSFNGSKQPPQVLEGIFLASDFSSRKSLTYIEITELVRILRLYGEDHVTFFEMGQDPNGKAIITRATRKPARNST